MVKERYNILIGGPAGTGPNFLTEILGEALVERGQYVFFSRDYQSLIRGGHNFNVLTFSREKVSSNDSKIDVLVCLDENTKTIHNKNLNKEGIVLEGHKENAYYLGQLFKLLGMDFKSLDKLLKKEKRYTENIKFALEGYEKENKNICKINSKKKGLYFENGSQSISEGAIKSGLDVHFAYPMTPATPVIGELAKEEKKKNIITIELENEIAVANAGIGCAMTGAKTMVSTSGGGFDLMTETLSLSGMAEVSLVFYLAQRPGPATGVATYTAQGDLNIARHAGHGEFNRIVVAPGDPKEAKELMNQVFYLSQKYSSPGIIISDKHLGESYYAFEEKPKIVKIPKKIELKRYNSYEKDSEGSATENPEIVVKNINERKKTGEKIKRESKKFSRYSVYGKKKSKNVVVFWGSTKGAILDAIKDLDVKAIQLKYIEPFPEKVIKELKGNLILIENNSTGQLGDLIREKMGIEIKKKILKYDARPFFADELKKEIGRRI